MSFVYGLTGFTSTAPQAINGNGAPPTGYRGILGQQWFDITQTPPTEYIYNGQTWTTGGNSPATTTQLCFLS
jgi:hypothetical protein